MAKAKKEYLESICGEISEFQRARLKIWYKTYMKTKELGWKENWGIQNIDIDEYKGYIIEDKRKYREFGRIIFRSSTIDLINQKN
jgi:hypothetical protein